MTAQLSDDGSIDWPGAIFDVIRTSGINQVGYVPDAGHSRLISLCHGEVGLRSVVLTTEEEGIGLVAGAWLGGERSALLMQSSGVGNCVNALAMVKTCRFPLLMLVTMRGEWGEFNPWQVAMGQSTRPCLELAGVIVYQVDRPEEVGETVDAAAALAFDSEVAVAVLLSQRLIGRKVWGAAEAGESK